MEPGPKIRYYGKNKRLTAAAPRSVSVHGVLFSTFIALFLLTTMQAGLSPAELKGGIAMLNMTSTTLVAGFASSYVAGLALLP